MTRASESESEVESESEEGLGGRIKLDNSKAVSPWFSLPISKEVEDMELWDRIVALV